jgi:hypothetical protein
MTPKEYAHWAGEAGVIAEEIRPRGADTEFQPKRDEAVYYLRRAKSILQLLAETKAEQERVNK